MRGGAAGNVRGREGAPVSGSGAARWQVPGALGACEAEVGGGGPGERGGRARWDREGGPVPPVAGGGQPAGAPCPLPGPQPGEGRVRGLVETPGPAPRRGHSHELAAGRVAARAVLAEGQLVARVAHARIAQALAAAAAHGAPHVPAAVAGLLALAGRAPEPLFAEALAAGALPATWVTAGPAQSHSCSTPDPPAWPLLPRAQARPRFSFRSVRPSVLSVRTPPPPGPPAGPAGPAGPACTHRGRRTRGRRSARS